MLPSRRASDRSGGRARNAGRVARMSAAGALSWPGGASGSAVVLTSAILALRRIRAVSADPPRLEQLDAQYREHHRERRTPDFVYGGEERASLFRDLVGGPGRRVLDLGCRYGALTRAYVGGNVVGGVAVAREALAEAAKLGIETRWADVEQPLDFPDASFDVVVAGELLEHLRDPDAVVAEARRVLRPGGRLVGAVPTAVRARARARAALGLGGCRAAVHLWTARTAERAPVRERRRLQRAKARLRSSRSRTGRRSAAWRSPTWRASVRARSSRSVSWK